jgi:hypothetical protein
MVGGRIPDPVKHKDGGHNMAKENWLVIGLIVLVAAYALNIGGLQQLIGGGTGAATPPPPSGGGVTPPASNGACPDTLVTAFKADSINPLNASTTEYQVQNFRLIPSGNFAEFLTLATVATSARTNSASMMCDHSYTLYPLALIDAVNSVAPVELGKASGASMGKVVIAPKFALLTAKAYDNANRAAVWNSADQTAAGTMDPLAAHFDSTTNNTGVAIGVGGYIDWNIDTQSVSTVAQFGNSDLGLYIAFDADKSSYDTPSVWVGGSALQNVKGTGEVSANDEAVLSSYEYIFKVPAGVKLATAPTAVRVYVAAKAGQDPSADLVLRFVAKGYYVGGDGVSIKKDIFNEATNSEIATATAQTVTIDVT